MCLSMFQDSLAKSRPCTYRIIVTGLCMNHIYFPVARKYSDFLSDNRAFFSAAMLPGQCNVLIWEFPGNQSVAVAGCCTNKKTSPKLKNFSQKIQ